MQLFSKSCFILSLFWTQYSFAESFQLKSGKTRHEYAERFSAEKVNLNTDWANNIQKVTPSPRSRCNKAQFISLQIDKHSVFNINFVRKLNLSHQRKKKKNKNFIVLSGERIRWYLRSYFFCLSSASAFDITFVKDICVFMTAGSSWLYVKVNELK